MKKKWLTLFLACCMAALCAAAFTACGETEEDDEDSDLVYGDWNKYTFTVTDDNRKDGDETESLSYQVFVPSDYDSSVSYPLITFVPDASISTIGASKKEDGAKIWTTDEEQAKHPCLVLVVGWTATLTGDEGSFDPQGEYLEDIIYEVCDAFSIDTDRLYMTGQSQGGMTSFWYNINRPDLFAATIYVACQWPTDGMDETIVYDKFFYIVSDGDERAGPGQVEVQEVLDTAGVTYGYVEDLDATDTDGVESAVETMLESGYDINMVRYRSGTVAGEGASASSEHSGTWAYAYTIEAVRDWLFEQSK